VALLEKEADIASGTTKANSGVVHAGYASPREYVKRDMCINGNKLYTQAAEELNFPFQRIGSFVVALEDSQIKTLEEERKLGTQDGVPGLELILDKEKIKYMEPNLTDEAVGVLHAPSAGIVSPYEMTYALAENAAMNGVKFFRNQKVRRIKQLEKKKFKVVVLGDPSVGKTSTILRFTDNVFLRAYIPTMGLNITQKIFDVNKNAVELVLW
ncbi:unnamed protein product, partial [marine sediment metagenome]